MLVFWNRELTDETTTRYAEVSSDREETRTSKSSKGNDNSLSKSEDTLESKISSGEKSSRALTGGTYTALDPNTSSLFQTAFQQAWLTKGVEVVDRNAIIRNMSIVANKEDRGDLQLLEASALKQNIQYLIEVLPNANSGSPTGYVFQVKIIHLPSSTVVAQFLSSGAPPRGPDVWVAGPSGFVKQSQDRADPERIGAELAVEAMGRFLPG
jgi:hypothetical protein